MGDDDDDHDHDNGEDITMDLIISGGRPISMSIVAEADLNRNKRRLLDKWQYKFSDKNLAI